MLDTDTCIDVMRGRAEPVLRTLDSHAPEEVGISSIVFAELHTGVCKSSNPGRNLELLTDFCTPLTIASFDSLAAERYGIIREHLERVGTPIGPLDTLIAAHALSVGAILVTRNEQEFRRVPGLKVENWMP